MKFAWLCVGLKRLWAWLCKVEPQGFGTLLVGLAAVGALVQSSGVLDKILEIQKQAKGIETAVKELKDQSIQISNAVSLLSSQLKEIKAQSTVNTSPALRKSDSSKEQIEEAIRALPSYPTPGESSIYLPEESVDATVDLIFKAKTPSQRASILQNYLNYKPASLVHGN